MYVHGVAMRMRMWWSNRSRVGQTVVEDRYVSLYQTVDLTRDFYFSYTLDLTRPIQHSMVHVPADEVPQRTTTPPHPRMRRGTVSTHPLGCENPMFVWNECVVFVARRCSAQSVGLASHTLRGMAAS